MNILALLAKGIFLSSGFLRVAIMALAVSFTSIAHSQGEVSEPQLVGTPVQISENRGRLAVEINGEPFIAAFSQDNFQGGVRVSLLLINPITGETEQYWFPEEKVPTGSLFHMLRGSNGRIYATIGQFFVEFDLQSKKWSFQQRIPDKAMAMAFMEAANGKVYFGTYPYSNLWEFDPSQRKLRKVGRLDSVEEYPRSLASDQHGWIYAGIGTARSNLVALHAESGERRQLAKESERKVGLGLVQLGVDGTVYGRVHDDSPWMRLEDGRMFRFEGDPEFIELGQRDNAHFYYKNWAIEFSSGGKIIKCDLPTKQAEIVDRHGKKHEISFNYVSNGPTISSLEAGTDGNIYGSTNHPMHFWKWEPEHEKFTDFGGIPAVGGGNFPNFSAKGDYLIGPTYPSGRVYAYNLTKPWDPEENNPRMVGKYPVMKRPRVSFLLQDGHTVVMSGFPGYGITGGGMVFYDSEADTTTVLSNEDVLTGHSTVALRQLPDGMLVGGTSTAAPGGGKRLVENSVVYQMDPVSQKIEAQTEIGSTVSSLEILRNGKVVGVTHEMLFIYDPDTQGVVSQSEVSSLGAPLNHGQSLVRDPTGDVYLVFSESIAKVDPSGKPVELVRLPETARAGTVILDGYLYYVAGSQLWRYQLPKPLPKMRADSSMLPATNNKELRHVISH